VLKTTAMLKPAAKDIEAAALRPGLGIPVPPGQLLAENLVAISIVTQQC
jgi:hypothetical protein